MRRPRSIRLLRARSFPLAQVHTEVPETLLRTLAPPLLPFHFDLTCVCDSRVLGGGVFGTGFKASQHSQHSVQNREWVRWASGDVEIDGNLLGHSAERRIGTREGSAADGTRADRNHKPRGRHCCICFAKGEFHVLSNWTCHDDPIRMPWRCHELDTEAAEVEHDIAERHELGFTAIASASRNLAQLEGS